MPETFLHVLKRGMGKMLENQLDHMNRWLQNMKVTAVTLTASNKYFDKDFLNIKSKY